MGRTRRKGEIPKPELPFPPPPFFITFSRFNPSIEKKKGERGREKKKPYFFCCSFLPSSVVILCCRYAGAGARGIYTCILSVTVVFESYFVHAPLFATTLSFAQKPNTIFSWSPVFIQFIFFGHISPPFLSSLFLT